MRMFFASLLLLVAISAAPGHAAGPSDAVPMPSYLSGYEAIWSKDPHAAAMEWFKQAKCGLFVTFSPASLVGQAGWSKADAGWTKDWHARNAKLDTDRYDRYLSDYFDAKLMSPAAAGILRRFTAKEFDADKIADLAVAAGAKYIIFTTRHVLGRMYLFKTTTSPINSVEMAPQRDFVAELAKACDKRKLGLFLYVSAPFTTPVVRDRCRTMLTELLSQYGPIAGIWFDGIGQAYQRPAAFEPAEVERTYQLVRDRQPQCLISFKTGYTGTEDYLAPEWHQCTYGPDGLPRIGRYDADGSPDASSIPEPIRQTWENTLRHLPAETSTTLLMKDRTELWFDEPGNAARHKSAEAILAQFRTVQARKQNFAVNIALRGDGSIHPADELALRAFGRKRAEP